MSLASRVALQKAEPLLVRRLEALRNRVEAGEEVWPELCECIRTLVAIAPAVAPDANGMLLTTGQMAERLGMSTKTLLRHKANGKIKPAVARGKLLRWSGRETL